MLITMGGSLESDGLKPGDSVVLDIRWSRGRPAQELK